MSAGSNQSEAAIADSMSQGLTPSRHAWQSAAMQPNTQPLVIEGAIERANRLILNSLKAGRRNAREILAAAEGAKISERTIQRAAIALGVAKTKAGFNGGWAWRLPADGDEKDLRNVQTPGHQQDAVADYQGNAIGLDKIAESSSRAKVIAGRLRRLEEIRGKKAPIYAEDSRVKHWADSGISDPDLREAYERAVTTLEEAQSQAFVSVGFLNQFVMQVISEGDKA